MIHFTDYSDQALQAVITDTTAKPATQRCARLFLEVPVEVREAISCETWTLGNLIQGRPSDHLRQAVDEWKRSGRFVGTESAEAYRQIHQHN